MQQNRYEIVRLESHGEWHIAQLAVDSILTEAFWVHKSVRLTHPTEESFIAYLQNSAESMLEQFGDVRQGARYAA